MRSAALLVESLGRLAFKGQLPGAELDILRPTGFRPDVDATCREMYAERHHEEGIREALHAQA